MSAFPPLAAMAIDDLIWLIAVILFFVVPVIGKFLAKMKKPQQQQRPQRRQPPPQRPQAAAQPAGGNIEDEIGDFLRRAARGRGGAPQQQPQVRPVEAVVVEAPREVVKPTIDTGRLARHASGLGREVAHADAKAEDRVHEALDHEVSPLAQQRQPKPAKKPASAKAKAKRRRRPAPVPQTAAAGFAAMLGSTENLRQAIVLSEIINRPTDRWE